MRLAAALLVLVMSLAAFAEVGLEAELDRSEFFAASTAAVHIRIRNDGTAPLTDLRIGLGESEVKAQEWPLLPGETKELNEQISITKAELKQGFVTVTLRYRENGVENLQQCLCRVTRLSTTANAELMIELPRHPVTADTQTVCTLVIRNTGSVEIVNGVLTVCGEVAAHGISVPAGGYTRVETELTAREDEEITASLVCESAYSGEQTTVNASPVRFTFLNGELRLYAIPDRSVSAGESARITVNIENNSNASYSALKLTDGKMSSIPGLPARLEAGSFFTLTYVTGPLYEATEFCVTLTGIRDDGERISLQTEPFLIGAEQPDVSALAAALTAESVPDGIRIVFCAGAENVSDLVITQQDGTILRRIPLMRAGEQVELMFEPAAGHSAEYRFTAEYLGPDGAQRSLKSGTVHTEGKQEGVTDVFRDLTFALVNAGWLGKAIIYVSAAVCVVLLTVMTVSGRKKTGDKNGSGEQ